MEFEVAAMEDVNTLVKTLPAESVITVVTNTAKDDTIELVFGQMGMLGEGFIRHSQADVTTAAALGWQLETKSGRPV